MIVKKLYITLLELMLVIAILGIVAGFIGINVSKSWREQRFRTEVSLVVDQLRLAQNLMLIFNSNVMVKFVATEDGIDYQLAFDTPLPKHWSQEINRSHDKLTTLKVINFNDLLESEDNIVLGNVRNGISIKFLSGGSRMSRGIVRLSTSEDEGGNVLTRYVLLPGYPSPIYSQVQMPAETQNSSSLSFERNLTQLTKEEVELNVREM